MKCIAVAIAVMLAGPGVVRAQDMAPDTKAAVDAAIKQVVEKTGVPSASVGIVQGGRIVFTQAYGDAKLKPEMKATAAMSYPVGSISKQFTATCILLLQEDGKLTLDDTVSRWFPKLTRANEVTLRELLSHTSGYEDYAPQDYTIPAWTKPGDPLKLVEEWAGKPLDFEPGTQWQYSNTNFVLAALIVEKASGMPFFKFLQQRVLNPVGLSGALDLDTDRARLQVQGYERHALAPLRPAILEAPGWYFGDGSLAMPVADLLKWDIAIMDQKLLKPASYEAFETAVKLKDGKSTRYGLGVSVLNQGGHRIIEHSGEVGGFVAENMVLPDEKVAIAVLTNQEASPAASEIAGAVAKLLLPKSTAAVATIAKPEETQLKVIMAGLQDGKIDRALFTSDANFYFSKETMDDFASSLKPLGAVASVSKKSESLRGGMTFRSFTVGFAGGESVTVTTYTMPDGKLEQLLVEGKD
jgi:CubicO group peptidase (beta-lactamase class C family)